MRFLFVVITIFFVSVSGFAAEPTSAEPLAVTPPVEAAQSENGERAEDELDGGEQPETPDLLATGAAVVPGLLLHGSGHFVAGERATAGKLALAQLAGMFMAVGGIAILAVTGADPKFTPPGALIAMYGVGLFGSSFLADIFGVATPPGGVGDPVTKTDWLSYRGGYRYVDSPIFEFRRHGATAGLSYRSGAFGLDVDALTVVTSAEVEAGADARYRLTGPRPDRRADDGSYSDLLLGYDFREFDRGEFQTHTVDLFWDNRWDLRNFAPTLDGSFILIGAGVALQTIHYDDLPDIVTTLLLSRMGFGIDIGESTDGWGDALVYYDHRHDGPAAGFKITGLGSGNAGHFGARWRQHVYRGWGFYTGTEIGSAWVVRAGVERRFGGER
jgi:hypothetical protein